MSRLTVTPFTAAAILLVAGANLSLAAVTLARPAAPAGEVLALSPAYGEDDEDCVMQLRRTVMASGAVILSRRVVCADADSP